MAIISETDNASRYFYGYEKETRPSTQQVTAEAKVYLADISTTIKCVQFLGVSDRLNLFIQNDGSLQLLLLRYPSTIMYYGTTATGILTADDAWHQVAVSYKYGVTTYAAIDGVAYEMSNINEGSYEFNYSNAGLFAIGPLGKAGNAISYAAVYQGDWWDFTDSDELGRFQNTDGKPIAHTDKNPIAAVSSTFLGNNGSYQFSSVADTGTLSFTDDDEEYTWEYAHRWASEPWGTCDRCGWHFPKSELVQERFSGLTVCTTYPRCLDRPGRDQIAKRQPRGRVWY